MSASSSRSRYVEDRTGPSETNESSGAIPSKAASTVSRDRAKVAASSTSDRSTLARVLDDQQHVRHRFVYPPAMVDEPRSTSQRTHTTELLAVVARDDDERVVVVASPFESRDDAFDVLVGFPDRTVVKVFERFELPPRPAADGLVRGGLSRSTWIAASSSPPHRSYSSAGSYGKLASIRLIQATHGPLERPHHSRNSSTSSADVTESLGRLGFFSTK